MDQPGTDKFFQPEKLESDQATLDDMAARVLTGLIMVDAFDNGNGKQMHTGPPPWICLRTLRRCRC